MDLGGNDEKCKDARVGYYRNSFPTVFLIVVTQDSVFSANISRQT